MKVRLAPRALQDLIGIREHYRRIDLVLSERIANRLMEVIDLLRRRPDIGVPSKPDPLIRSKLVNSLPYRIYYRVRGDALEIVHIRHTARRDWNQKTE